MPDSSQYIQIKRLQTGINGRIANTKTKRGADTYEGYAGSFLATLPPNALLSNKFIVPETGGGGGGGDCDLVEVTGDKSSYWLDPCTNFKYADSEGAQLIGYDGDVSEITSLEIPDTVTSIAESAFISCTSLETLTLSTNLVSIGKNAFSDCSSLTSLVIPDSVTSIGDSAFGECSTLQNLTLSNQLSSLGQSAFLGCYALTSLEIPGSLIEISKNAFRRCGSLVDITFNPGLTKILDSAFYDCASLKNINLPSGTEIIEINAFFNAASAETLTLPDSITTIGNDAFLNISTTCILTTNLLGVDIDTLSVGGGYPVPV